MKCSSQDTGATTFHTLFNIITRIIMETLKINLKFGLAVLIVNVTGVISIAQSNLWDNPYTQPYFDNTTKRELTITVGQTAELHCRVRNLGDRAVSWIRKHDLHIITIGIMTYTNDQRFQAIHPDSSDEWILRISSAQPRDSGIYECQVSTEPKMSLPFRITIVVAKAKILANNELFFKSGSDINLTCISLQATQPPSYIYWYKDGYLINYSQRGGINVLTERQTRTSTLVISRAVPPDSGNYTCIPSNSNSDSVLVHVIKSEHRAAMQHENKAPHCYPIKVLLIGTLCMTIIIFRGGCSRDGNWPILGGCMFSKNSTSAIIIKHKPLGRQNDGREGKDSINCSYSFSRCTTLNSGTPSVLVGDRSFEKQINSFHCTNPTILSGLCIIRR